MEEAQEEVVTSRVRSFDNSRNTAKLYLPTGYLSYSQITKYMLCPKAYEFSYIKGIKEVLAPKTLVGIAGHKVLELLSEFGTMDFTSAELREHFEMAFKDIMVDIPKGDVDPNEYTVAKENLFPSIELYCKKVVPTLNVVAQEVQITADIPITRYNKGEAEIIGTVPVVGFIDILNHKTQKVPFLSKAESFEKVASQVALNDIEIGDYKTGAEKDYTHFIGDYQTPLYAFATGITSVRIDNIMPCKVKFNKDGGPRKDNVPPSYKILQTEVTKDDMVDMVSQFSAIATSISSGSFPKCSSSSWLCTEKCCGYWKQCRGITTKYYSENTKEQLVTA